MLAGERDEGKDSWEAAPFSTLIDLKVIIYVLYIPTFSLSSSLISFPVLQLNLLSCGGQGYIRFCVSHIRTIAYLYYFSLMMRLKLL